MLCFILHALIVVILTLLTQIGGVVYLITLAVVRALRIRRFPAKLALFLLLYAGATVVANLTAPTFGRVPLSCVADAGDPLVIRSPIYCALNRNYVTPELSDLARALATHMDKQFPGTVTVALDANFPFVNGFPLLPHLSHADGKKLDFAYYYKDADGAFLNGATRSPIGYFAFEEPAAGDELPCAGRHDWLTTRWDFDGLQPLFPAYRIEEQRTAAAVAWLTTEGAARFGLQKIFIEPHIKNALGITDAHVRFQGCRAARHDDHIHIQVE
ncbi:hypothetical protein HJB51_05675 [Rhizobium lentis]|uniref:hypothetical protein n=1 Tax=Rhizobium lentis TaxID=1138194 RepID=UPI001C836C07|nr:hypothetical protein [Rhizobium lentis]MBX5039605.1 hypothetical protein [Rhizobium lentis]MBX5052554.1 hypothetical protein [Rhizobium lentis]MBX5069230.1 hypothetical protein [Rhizobium lentis]MBX5107494.1 hypothetical protein [Rhizobium lentis]MBX5113340.1 hypothetical protein [Rhizobium lentis]